MLIISLSVTLGWIIYIGFILLNCQRLPLDVSDTSRGRVPNGNVCFFGYLTLGFETSTLLHHFPGPEEYGKGPSGIDCWVDWDQVAKTPWWSDYPIKGYAVVAGRIEQASVPMFGHFGQYKRQLILSKIVIPPLPVTAGYWLISVMICNAIGLLLGFRKGRKIQHETSSQGRATD
jgi:hypothetical protein